jgi:hypothetical protein
MCLSKESNNLEQAESLGVHDNDYVLYGSQAEQLLAHKEKILAGRAKGH